MFYILSDYGYIGANVLKLSEFIPKMYAFVTFKLHLNKKHITII